MPRYNREADMGPIVQDLRRRLKLLERPYRGDRGVAYLTAGASPSITCGLATPTSMVLTAYYLTPTGATGALYASCGTGTLTIHSTNGSDGNAVVWQIIG